MRNRSPRPGSAVSWPPCLIVNPAAVPGSKPPPLARGLCDDWAFAPIRANAKPQVRGLFPRRLSATVHFPTATHQLNGAPDLWKSLRLDRLYIEFRSVTTDFLLRWGCEYPHFCAPDLGLVRAEPAFRRRPFSDDAILCDRTPLRRNQASHQRAYAQLRPGKIDTRIHLRDPCRRTCRPRVQSAAYNPAEPIPRARSGSRKPPRFLGRDRVILHVLLDVPLMRTPFRFWPHLLDKIPGAARGPSDCRLRQAPHPRVEITEK